MLRSEFIENIEDLGGHIKYVNKGKKNEFIIICNKDDTILFIVDTFLPFGIDTRFCGFSKIGKEKENKYYKLIFEFLDTLEWERGRYEDC